LTLWSIRIPHPVRDPRHARGLIDTSVIIDLEQIERADLPLEVAVSAITMAELAAGPHATAEPAERARRQDRLQRAEATFEPLPVDAEVARAYGRVYAAVTASGRKARGRRAVDLLIAATAVAARLPLYTRNPDDFVGLSDLLEIVSV
jgi:predicted nucleic acid-binding protein